MHATRLLRLRAKTSPLARLPRLTPSAIFMASLAWKSPKNGGASLVLRFMIERRFRHTSTRGSVAPRRTSNRRFTGDCIHSLLLRRGIRLRQRRQVARRAKRGALRSKVARGRATEPPDSLSFYMLYMFYTAKPLCALLVPLSVTPPIHHLPEIRLPPLA